MGAKETIGKEALASADSDLRNYRDAIGEMTDRERDRLRGKVLAILCETGRIVAVESTVEELTSAVEKTQFQGLPWRLMDGPGDEPPLSVDDFLTLHGETSIDR